MSPRFLTRCQRPTSKRARAATEWECEAAAPMAAPVGESLRLLNEVISASRMVDLFINARAYAAPSSSPIPLSLPALLAPSFAPSSDRFNDTNHGGSQ